MRHRWARRFGVMSLGFVLSVYMYGQFSWSDESRDTNSEPEHDETYRLLSNFSKVFHFVQQNYVSVVPQEKLIQGAFKGMLETLDPHSMYLDSDQFREIKVDTSGHFSGVGVELTIQEGKLKIVSVLEGTPAERSGLKPGDEIVSIQGELLQSFHLEEIVKKMKGQTGTTLKLSVVRKGSKKPKIYSLVRENIKIKSVRTETIDSDFLYIRINSFSERVSLEVKKALDAHKGAKAVLIDLRNNPGGLLDQAIELVSLFVGDGVVVSTKGQNAAYDEIKPIIPGKVASQAPLIVLVNEGSASASEIVAGALQDHHRAIIMGRRTFGKGSIQTVNELIPDSAIKLTVALYYTPSGRSIQKEGIRPDVILDEASVMAASSSAKKRSRKLKEGDLRNALGNGNGESSQKELDEDDDDSDALPLGQQLSKKPDEDPEVLQALNLLKTAQKLHDLKW